MMTPSELREYEFKGAGRNAYKSDDVDTFFGEVAVAYEKIYRENAELVKRIGLLADRLEQFKHDEEQIKQAVIGAQKAADIIVKEAERSVEDSKSEAEAILAAAKGEADIIKSDAEKQAVADSDLLLSIARDKAEEIINKAKEEAHGILIEANDSAKDTVGAATRTLTSESLHYEMLKKEVSEFRASILAQYKAHIELISKLPELAVKEAEKKEETKVESTDADESLVEEIVSVDPDNDIIEIVSDEEEIDVTFAVDEELVDGEEVIKTTLPYDFFEENSTLEFVDDNCEESFEIDVMPGLDETISTNDDESSDIVSEETDENSAEDDVEEIAKEEATAEDIMISKAFSVNPFVSSVDSDSTDDSNDSAVFSDQEIAKKAVFAAFETIEDDEVDEEESSDKEPKKRRGFFRRKK